MTQTTFPHGSLVIITAPGLLETQVGVVIGQDWRGLWVLTVKVIGPLKRKYVALA